jgi:hypothetical protein
MHFPMPALDSSKNIFAFFYKFNQFLIFNCYNDNYFEGKNDEKQGFMSAGATFVSDNMDGRYFCYYTC